MRPAWFVVSLVAALLVAASPPGRACSCLPRRPLGETLSLADAVFEGRPARAAGSASDGHLGALSEYRFVVSRRWKGDVPAMVSVWTPNSCPVSALDGVSSYLVSATLRQGRWLMTVCDDPIPITATTDLSPLGTPLPPLEVSDLPTRGCAVAGPGGGMGTDAALALALVLALRRRRR